MNKKFIIFTDLDSTLLDENYSWKEAIPALEKINKLKIPLILNSSKTICEIEEIRNELNLFYPVIADAGIDPIWFGIFAVIVVEFGLISPPIGMNLFVIKGVMQRTPLQTIWFGTVPFLITDVIRLVLIIAFPAICLYLPSLLMR